MKMPAPKPKYYVVAHEGHARTHYMGGPYPDEQTARARFVTVIHSPEARTLDRKAEKYVLRWDVVHTTATVETTCGVL